MARPKSRRKQRFPHLLGSKWTSVHPILGWRHFQVKERQQGKGGLVFAELVAVCDPQVRLWVNAAVLKNRELWQAGWVAGIPCKPETGDNQEDPQDLEDLDSTFL
ncbi:MAG: TIGR02450 family Trp-rich protein [Thermostichus sp. DG_1_6_bins_120]